MKFFSAGFEDLHNDLEQMIRQEKSAELEINWTPKLDEKGEISLTPKGAVRKNFDFDGRLKTCKIKTYLVTLENCTCIDFTQRHLPCKHMYKLASRLGLFVRNDSRSQDLIADFSTGYSAGWRFLARPCNYLSLDIKRQKLILTQGRQYNFSAGQIFYDNIAGYTEIWRDALQKIKITLQIDSATKTKVSPIVLWDGKRYVRQDKIIYGLVNFSVYKPNYECTRVEKVANYTCRQNEFVELLKTGRFVDENGEIISLE